MNFQKIVLNVAVIIYCLFMLAIGLLMINSQKNVNFPPDVSICPDYWEASEDGTCKYTNTDVFRMGNLGANECNSKNFNTSEFMGADGKKINVNGLKKCVMLNGMELRT